MSNPYWENICSLAEKQRSKGIATYGQGLEANPADVVARINHLQEELIDALMYCEWIKDTIVPCQECKWYDPEGEFCKHWNGVRHPEHSCGDGERKDNG